MVQNLWKIKEQTVYPMWNDYRRTWTPGAGPSHVIMREDVHQVRMRRRPCKKWYARFLTVTIS